jgi:hypothetical protein
MSQLFREVWPEPPDPDDEDRTERFEADRLGLFAAVIDYMNLFFAMITGMNGKSVSPPKRSTMTSILRLLRTDTPT